MDDRTRTALETDRTIDITTIGRRSGEPHRVEIWFHRVGGSIYITGSPGERDWYANLLAEPWFTFHLKDSVRADLKALAEPITDPDERRRILAEIRPRVGASAPLEEWLARSPLVRVEFL
jgi:deazaflavin-dependent oxidoreductase (nitroreductase family)